MRRTTITLMLASVLLLPGCGADERTRLLASQEIFAATIDTLIVMRRAGEFDETEIERLDTLIDLGGNLLDKWEARILAGESSPGAADQFQTILSALQKYQGKAVDPNE